MSDETWGSLAFILVFLILSPHRTCQNKEGEWGRLQQDRLKVVGTGFEELVISEYIVLSLWGKELFEAE